MREQLENIYRMSGIKPKELDITPPPDSLSYIYELFVSIKNSSSGIIDLNQIKSYSEFMLADIEPYEAQLIIELDTAYQRTVNG